MCQLNICKQPIIWNELEIFAGAYLYIHPNIYKKIRSTKQVIIKIMIQLKKTIHLRINKYICAQ